MPSARIAPFLISTHKHFKGCSKDPFLFPIQHASDFSKFNFSDEKDWNDLHVWKTNFIDSASEDKKSASSAYADNFNL